jgi:large subunit ribosomal protein L23
MSSKAGVTSVDYDLIRYPVMTEKSTKILNDSNAYVFVVEKRANKPGIKRAIERIFGVKVESVNTILVKGKRKVFRGRWGRRSDYKKAIVRLDPGSRIDLGTGV